MRCETSRFLRWRTQLHKNDSQCESFFIYSVNFISQSFALWMISARLIRCSWTMNDEENINKLLRGEWIVARIFWEVKLHSAKFWPCDSELIQIFACQFDSKIFYHYNVYIIMIFLIFIIKYHDTNVYKIFSLKKQNFFLSR